MPGKGGRVCCPKGRVAVSWSSTRGALRGALHGALQFRLKQYIPHHTQGRVWQRVRMYLFCFNSLFKGLGPTLECSRKVSWILSLIFKRQSSSCLVVLSRLSDPALPWDSYWSSVQMLWLQWIKVCWRVLTISSYIKVVEFSRRHSLPFQRVSCSINTFPPDFLSFNVSVCVSFNYPWIWLINLMLDIVGKWTLPQLGTLVALGEVVVVFLLHHLASDWFWCPFLNKLRTQSYGVEPFISAPQTLDE